MWVSGYRFCCTVGIVSVAVMDLQIRIQTYNIIVYDRTGSELSWFFSPNADSNSIKNTSFKNVIVYNLKQYILLKKFQIPTNNIFIILFSFITIVDFSKFIYLFMLIPPTDYKQ